MIDFEHEKFFEFKDYIKQSRSCAVTGLTSFLRILLIKLAKGTSKKKVLVVTSTEQNALKFQNDLNKAFNIDSSIITFNNITTCL